MKLPKHFNVFGQKIKIKSGDLGPAYDGMYYTHEKMIVINKEVLPENLDRVVIHEFLHSVIDRCSLTQVVTYPSEEVLVDMLTKALIENFEIKARLKK